MYVSVHSAVFFSAHRKVNPGACLSDRKLPKGRFPSHYEALCAVAYRRLPSCE
jgi:hypothetical protein